MSRATARSAQPTSTAARDPCVSMWTAVSTKLEKLPLSTSNKIRPQCSTLVFHFEIAPVLALKVSASNSCRHFLLTVSATRLTQNNLHVLIFPPHHI
jgi:hypothetical protein